MRYLLILWTALLAWFACSGAAAAAPIVGAVVAAVGLTGVAATVATSVISYGLMAGGSLLLGSLFGEKVSSVAQGGVQASVTFGSKQYHQGAFGRVATKGHYVYFNTYGSSNKYLDQVYRLSTGWCEGLVDVIIDGESCPLSEVETGTGWTKYAVTLPDDGGTRRLWVTFWDGRPDQVASPALIESANPEGRWTEEHVGAGICYVHVQATYSSKVDAFRNLLSGNSILFVYDGLKLYDLRKDSTAGGSGEHRFDDPSTWEFSRNPFVQAQHYERGLYINGKLAVGMGKPSYDILTEIYMASANVADEEVALSAGGTEPRYECSFLSSEGEEHIDAIEAFMRAGGAKRVERQGLSGLIAGAAQVPVATISDDDLLAELPVRFTAKRRREELTNEVYGQYTDPDNLYDGQDIVPVIGDETVKAIDGGETRPTTSDKYEVHSPTQGQRLLRIDYRRNRHQATAQIPLGEEAVLYELGDWIVWRDLTWEITSHDHDVNSDQVVLGLEQTSVQVFEFGSGDESAIELPATLPGSNPRPTNVSSLTLQATEIVGTDSQVLPAIAVGWDDVTDETIQTVVLEHKISGADDTTAIRTTHSRPASGDWDGTVLAAGIMAGTDYDVRSTITTFPIRTTTWGDWETIETSGNYSVKSAATIYDAAVGEVNFGDLISDLENTSDLARAIRDSLLGTGDSSVNDVLAQLGLAAESQLQSVLENEQRRVEAEGLGANISRVETLVNEQSLAFAEQITLLSAQVETNAAQVLRVDQARADGDSALASSLALVSTTVGEHTSSITELATSIDGISAQYVLSVSSGGAVGGITVTGIEKADGTGQVDIGFQADSFYIVNPDDTDTATKPFLFSGGTLYVNEAVIPTLTADKIQTGQIKSTDGTTMIIDLDEPYIIMQSS